MWRCQQNVTSQGSMICIVLNVGTQVRNVNAIISLNCCFNVVRRDSIGVIYAMANKLCFINEHSSQRYARCVQISNVSRLELYAGPPLVTRSKDKHRSDKRYIVNARPLVTLYAEHVPVFRRYVLFLTKSYLDMTKKIKCVGINFE